VLFRNFVIVIFFGMQYSMISGCAFVLLMKTPRKGLCPKWSWMWPTLSFLFPVRMVGEAFCINMEGNLLDVILK
jgi:hypothetical protein